MLAVNSDFAAFGAVDVAPCDILSHQLLPSSNQARCFSRETQNMLQVPRAFSLQPANSEFSLQFFCGWLSLYCMCQFGGSWCTCVDCRCYCRDYNCWYFILALSYTPYTHACGWRNSISQCKCFSQRGLCVEVWSSGI